MCVCGLYVRVATIFSCVAVFRLEKLSAPIPRRSQRSSPLPRLSSTVSGTICYLFDGTILREPGDARHDKQVRGIAMGTHTKMTMKIMKKSGCVVSESRRRFDVL